MLELNDMRLIDTVAKELHFGRAATRLHLSTARVSQRFGQLERRLGVKLARRTTRRMELTDVGRYVAKEAATLVGAWDAAEARINARAEGRTGRLQLTFIGSVSFMLMPRLLRLVSSHMPDVELEVGSQAYTRQIEAKLASRECDVGVLRTPIESPLLDCHTLYDDPLAIVVPEGHPLARAAHLDATALRDETFVTFPTGAGSVVGEAVNRVTETAGFSVRRRIEVTETLTLVGMVAAGMGVSIMPSSIRTLGIPGARFVDLDDAPVTQVSMAWRSYDEDPAVARLVALAKRAGGSLIGPTAATPDV